MWSKGGLKLDYRAMDYYHIVNTLHDQRSALIMNHIGRYDWETAALSVGYHRIIAGQH